MAYRKFTKAERRILRALQAKPDATCIELQTVCDLHRTYVSRLMKAMANEGLVSSKVALPTYKLTEEGQKLLDSLNNG